MKRFLMALFILFISNEAMAQSQKNECGKLLVDGKKSEYESCIKNTLEHVEKVSQN